MRKHDNYQDFERKNSIYVVRLNLTTHSKHTHSVSFREKKMCVFVSEWACVSGCVSEWACV